MKVTCLVGAAAFRFDPGDSAWARSSRTINNSWVENSSQTVRDFFYVCSDRTKQLGARILSPTRKYVCSSQLLRRVYSIQTLPCNSAPTSKACTRLSPTLVVRHCMFDWSEVHLTRVYQCRLDTCTLGRIYFKRTAGSHHRQICTVYNLAYWKTCSPHSWLAVRTCAAQY